MASAVSTATVVDGTPSVTPLSRRSWPPDSTTTAVEADVANVTEESVREPPERTRSEAPFTRVIFGASSNRSLARVMTQGKSLVTVFSSERDARISMVAEASVPDAQSARASSIAASSVA